MGHFSSRFSTPDYGSCIIRVSKLADSAGLDTDRFGEDLSSEAVVGRVAADIQMGIELEINSTPSVFLNNRRVPDVRAAALEALIEELLGN